VSDNASQELYARTLRHGIGLWQECLPKMQAHDASFADDTRARMLFIGTDDKELKLVRPTLYTPLSAKDMLGQVADRVRRRNVARSLQLRFIETSETDDGYIDRTLVLEHRSQPKTLNRPPYYATVSLGRVPLEGAYGQKAIAEICELVLQTRPGQLHVPRAQ
jgi:hypothetical protein